MRMVEWKKIEYVCSVITGGDAPLDCVKGQLSPTTTHPYPVFSNGDGVYGYCPSYRIAKDAVTVSSIGNVGSVNYRLAFFTPIIRLKVLVPNNDLLLTKFLYYALMDVKFIGTNSSLSSMKAADIKKIQIPVPSLAEQTRIVNILDTFTASIENLKQQIAQRRKQYEHYRDQLLDLEGKEGVEMKMLGDLGPYFGGLTGKTKEDFVEGNAKFITYMNVFANPALDITKTGTVKINEGEKQNKVQKGDILFTGSSETPEEAGMSCVVMDELENDYYLNSFCFGIHLNHLEQLNLGYLKHILRSDNVRKGIAKSASGVTRFNISKARFGKVSFPSPSFEEQQRIVSILDTFEASIANLEQQLAQREKQYEYYRNKLLKFD